MPVRSVRVSKEVPLAEITLRKYEKPYNIKGRDLVKKVCLSIGLLQPGDSRDVIVDILYSVVDSKKPLSSIEIEEKVKELRKKHQLPMVGIASSNIRRQLRRLKESFIIESVKGSYRINENASLEDIFREKIEQYYLKTIVDRVREYFGALKNV